MESESEAGAGVVSVVLAPPFDGEWKVVPGRKGEKGLGFEAIWPRPCGVPVYAPAAGRIAGVLPLDETGEAGTVALLLDLPLGRRVRLFPFRRRDLAVERGASVKGGELLGHLRSFRPRLVMWMEEEREGRWNAVPFRMGGYRSHRRGEGEPGTKTNEAWHYHEEGCPAPGDLLSNCARTAWMEACFRPAPGGPPPLYAFHTSEGTWREALDFHRCGGGDSLWISRSKHGAASLRFRLRKGCFQPLRFEEGRLGTRASLPALLWQAGPVPLHPLQGMRWAAGLPFPPAPPLPVGTGPLRLLLPFLPKRPHEGASTASAEIVFANRMTETFKIRRFLPAQPDFLLELTFSARQGLVEGVLKGGSSWSHIQRVS
ncbi:hypothetical protein [Verrucomicrobium sp. GAS474]|uniref:hypothetical protein n=1 Tax=Verrucomicrobium sp. GAS474 TaxID=1882831 RepID=UPI000B827CE2|nr:hypothetical protein [Verrucomicrobium sp. GAS474]